MSFRSLKISKHVTTSQRETSTQKAAQKVSIRIEHGEKDSVPTERAELNMIHVFVQELQSTKVRSQETEPRKKQRFIFTCRLLLFLSEGRDLRSIIEFRYLLSSKVGKRQEFNPLCR